MYRSMTLTAGIALGAAFAFPLSAQHVRLHVNPRWEDCAFQIDPSLTQGAWRQFAREAGLVSYFRPLIDARPLGRGAFEFSVLQWNTGIHDEDAAWNDTFVHPDSTHWLTEGSGLAFPGITLRAGLTKRIDVGTYFAKNPQSNYGIYAGQLQYNVVNDTTRNWAASARVSVASLFGPDDLGLRVYGVDAVASRTYALSSWASLSPYAGVSTYLSRVHETSALVNLRDESVVGTQGMLGVVARVTRVRIAAEYNVARVRSRSLKVGMNF